MRVTERQMVWPLSKKEQFETTLLSGRRVLVDEVSLYRGVGHPFGYVSGTIVRKSTGKIGKYRDAGAVWLRDMPAPILAKVIEQWRKADGDG